MLRPDQKASGGSANVGGDVGGNVSIGYTPELHEAALQKRQAIQVQLQAKVQVFQKEYQDQQRKFQKQLNTELQDQAKAFQATLRDYKVKREKEINAELQNQVNAFQNDVVDSQLKALNELDAELVKKVKRLKRIQAGGGTAASVFEEFPLAAFVALPVTALVVGQTVLTRREKLLSEQRRLREEEEERLRAEAAAAAAAQENATRKRRLKKEVLALLVTGTLGLGGFGLTTLIMNNYKGVDTYPPSSGEPVTVLPQQSKQEPPPPSLGGVVVTAPPDTPPDILSQESSSLSSLVEPKMMEEDATTVVEPQESQQAAAEDQSSLTPSISVAGNENKMESVLEHFEWPVLGAGGAAITATLAALLALFSKLSRPAAAKRDSKKAPPDFESVMATLREKRAKTLVVDKEEQSFSPPTSPTPIVQEEENAQSLDTSTPDEPEPVQTTVAEASDSTVAIEPTEIVPESEFPKKGSDGPPIINELGVSGEEVGEETIKPLGASQTVESPDAVEDTNEPEPVAEPANEDVLGTPEAKAAAEPGNEDSLDTPKPVETLIVSDMTVVEPESTEAKAETDSAKEDILDTPKTAEPMIVSDETVVEPESTEAKAAAEAQNEDILDTPNPAETPTSADETVVEPESTDAKAVATPQLELSPEPESNVPVAGELDDASESAVENLTGPTVDEIKLQPAEPEKSLVEDTAAESTEMSSSSVAEESVSDVLDELKPFSRVKKRSSAGQGFGKPQYTKNQSSSKSTGPGSRSST